MKIAVTIKSVYGTEKVYPACEKAKTFAAIAGTTTLTRETLQKIAALGVEIVALDMFGQPAGTLIAA